VVTKTAENIVAPNNLHKMIVRSGLKSNMVAELKGIQPPTLSRHKNGDIGISLTDAEEYAAILKCKPQEILFASPAIPLLAVVNSFEEADWDMPYEGRSSIVPGSGINGKDPILCLTHLFEKTVNDKYRDRVYYFHDFYEPNTMAVLWDFNTDHIDDIMKDYFNNSIEIVSTEGMTKGIVDKSCFGQVSYCYTKNHDLIRGYLYQSSRNKYTIESKHFGNYENIELRWACPAVNLIIRPDLRGVTWAEEKTDTLKKRMEYIK